MRCIAMTNSLMSNQPSSLTSDRDQILEIECIRKEKRSTLTKFRCQDRTFGRNLEQGPGLHSERSPQSPECFPENKNSKI